MSLFPMEVDAPPHLQQWDPLNWPVGAGWKEEIQTFFYSAEGKALSHFIEQRLQAGATVFPPQPFKALALTPLEKVRVVILGQDPYHGPHQAEGLAFSVASGVTFPPSLRNIFKELQRDLQVPIPTNGSLVRWAQQGVLLLNACLTVEQDRPASHAKKGCERLTDRLLMQVAAHTPVCVYMLWGAYAQAKAPLITETAQAHGRQALILQANHPSPLSALRPPRPFIGCGHFSLAQAWLKERGEELLW